MDDPYTKIPVGAKGTVSHVDDTGTIFVDWDMGSHLGVVYGEDSCQKLRTVKTICYGKEDVYDSREEAIAFYQQAAAGSEGGEQERYIHILLDLSEGKDICTDGISDKV